MNFCLTVKVFLIISRYSEDMNRKSIEQKTKIIQLLVEGNSLRATSRIVDCSINTVTKLFVEVGRACADYQDKKLVNLSCKRIEVDEIWSFVYARRQNVTPWMENFVGDVWTWTALCPDTKLMACWYVGTRDGQSANEFMYDLSTRLKKRIQITSDGYRPYKDAVEIAFGADVDFAMLVKQYGEARGKKYGPYEGAIKEKQTGNPDMSKTTTAHVERQNLNMRMSIRRFGRKTNAFSKKFDNHCHAVALHFMYYNFCRIHQTLRITPAMAAGITDRLWSIKDMLNVLHSSAAAPASSSECSDHADRTKI